MAWFIPLLAAGIGLQAGSQWKAGNNAASFGKAKNQVAEFEAAQLQRNAVQALAAGQLAAEEEKRRASLVASRALAVAAASGGGAADPTVVNIISDIKGEGAYRAALRIYQGKEEAQGFNDQAEATLYGGEVAKEMGKQERKASRYSVLGTLIGGATTYSLYEKYGGT